MHDNYHAEVHENSCKVSHVNNVDKSHVNNGDGFIDHSSKHMPNMHEVNIMHK